MVYSYMSFLYQLVPLVTRHLLPVCLYLILFCFHPSVRRTVIYTYHGKTRGTSFRVSYPITVVYRRRFTRKKYVEQGDKVTPQRCVFLYVQKLIPFYFQITLYGCYVRHPM